MSWYEEFLIVLGYSTRTQLAVVFGAVFYFGTLVLGDHLASSFVLHGVLAPLADTIRPIILNRYEHAAWGSLLGFLLLAVKCYRKDRKRLLHGLLVM